MNSQGVKIVGNLFNYLLENEPHLVAKLLEKYSDKVGELKLQDASVLSSILISASRKENEDPQDDIPLETFLNSQREEKKQEYDESREKEDDEDSESEDEGEDDSDESEISESEEDDEDDKSSSEADDGAGHECCDEEWFGTDVCGKCGAKFEDE